jgi:outer membrane receptor for ferrienterochelin and colicin
MKSSDFLSFRPARMLLLAGAVILSLALHAQSRQVKLRMSIRNATLEQFINRLENATGYSFVYGQDVRLAKRISMEVRDETLGELLQRAFFDQPVNFSFSGKHVLLTPRELPRKRDLQRFTISGYVTDSESSETLIGANVAERLRSSGTATNAFGFYSLTLPEGDVRLHVSYLGYEMFSSSFSLRKDTVLNISLRENNQLSEVVVLSDKKEAGIESTGMGSHDIPMTQVRHTPSILGEADVLKTIQLMPGVQAGMEGFSGLFVRGGGADQNLVMLDGIPVYNADHLLGVFSIFTPEAVKKVTLFKSSFPARYGGRLSSIVDVRTNDGDLKSYHGSLSLGTLTSKLHLEGPVVKDRTAFSLSARGTYTAFLANVVNNDDGKYNYYFYDFNAKLSHKFNDRSRLFAGFYNGKDHYHYDSDDSYTYLGDQPEDLQQQTSLDKNHLNWGNTLATLRWNYVLGNRLFFNTTLSYNNYYMLLSNVIKESSRYGQQKNTYEYASDYRSGIRDYGFRMDFDYTPVPVHHIKFGTEYLYHSFRPEALSSRVKETGTGIQPQDTAYSRAGNGQLYGHEVSVYAEDNLDLGEHLDLDLGLRLSLFHTQGKSYWSAQPRLSARYRLSGGFSLKAAYSQMEQYVHQLSSAALVMPTDLWVPITRNIRPMHARQYSAGAYFNGLDGWEFSLEAYYKHLDNVLEYQDGVSFLGSSVNWEEKVEMGEGRSYGVELLVQRTVGRTTGWMAYTLSKTERRFKDGSINAGAWFPYKYDRRHNISLCLNHKFSDRIDIGATWVFSTGGVATIPEGQTVIIYPDGHIEQADYISSRNNYRLPASHRLNIGVNFNRKTKHGERTWNISLYNAYNAMNPNLVYAQRVSTSWGYYPDESGNGVGTYGDTKTVLKKLTILPCIPSVTYTYRF